MKKITVLGLCLLTLGTAAAQKQLVKEVEREMKANAGSYPESVKKLAPAFNNEETSSDPFTYYVAGKGAFDYYDQQSVFAQMGKDVKKNLIGLSILEGYDYFSKALPLDTIVDAKGKVKTKYSKDIVKNIVNHYNDFNNAALFLWETEDYPNAVKAWELYTTLPQNPVFVKGGLKAPADTLLAEIMYNMGIGNSLAQNNEAALKDFRNAISHGYTKKNAYDYAISAASQLQNPQAMAEVAEEAYALYGKEDSRYIGYMINNLIDKKEYAKADALIDKYIAEDPGNAQLYFVKGVLCDSEGNPEASMAAYKKAIEIDDKNANALMQYGYKLYQRACDIDQNEGGNMSNQQYNEFRNTKVDPLLKEAAGYLEKAYQLDDTISDARQVLRSIYYNLNDEENLKRVEAM
ncbi:MAG: hypothetical protein K2H14_03560 [Muribaculaceae bacterium]|nr:hypothetical protein [Muribaculaceae bacterium]